MSAGDAAVARVLESPEQLARLVGTTVGPTAWHRITQDHIHAFAELSNDRQWIHVDPERARREGPFGCAVAHGNLTLSLIDGFREELFEWNGFELGLAFGWDRVRFPAPVPAGGRVRGRVEVTQAGERRAGWWELAERWTVEVEGAPRPAVVADRAIRLRVSGSTPAPTAPAGRAAG